MATAATLKVPARIAVILAAAFVGVPASAQQPGATLEDDQDVVELFHDGATHSAGGAALAVRGDNRAGNIGSQTRAYPFSTTRLGDFVNGGGCPDGEVLVDVVTTYHSSPDVVGSTVHPTCMPWKAVDEAPAVPSVTQRIPGERIREYLPRPVAQMNPSAHAITGLEVWLWYGDDGRQGLQPVDHDGDPQTPPRHGFTVDLSDPVNSISATVWIEQYRWELGDGTTKTSSRPGSEDDPAARHLYSRTDPDNSVTATTVWTGTFDWSNRDGSGTGISLGTVTVAGAPVPYPVREVRAVPAQPQD